MGETRGKVFDELIGHDLTAWTDGERRNQLRFRVESNPRPNIADSLTRSGEIGSLLLHGHESPHLVDFDDTRVETAKFLVHNSLAAFAHSHAEPHNRVAVNAGDTLHT